MLFQPFSVGAVVGADALHKRPERFRVIHVSQMAKLMHDHVVKNRRRRQHKPPVEGEGASRAAASPAGLLIADGDAFETPSCERKEIGGAFRKIFPGGVDITLFEGRALLVRQVGRGTVFAAAYGFQIMRDDPVLLVRQEALYLRFGGAKGQPQDDFSLSQNADCACPAAAVDDLVGQFI